MRRTAMGGLIRRAAVAFGATALVLTTGAGGGGGQDGPSAAYSAVRYALT